MTQADHIRQARQALKSALQMLGGTGAGTPDMLTKAYEAVDQARDQIDAAIRVIHRPAT